MFRFLPRHKTPDLAVDEWTVDTIVKHRFDKGGRLQFLTRWEGAMPGEKTWEPVENFVTNYCYEIVNYCRKENLQLDLTTYLRDNPVDRDIEPGR